MKASQLTRTHSSTTGDVQENFQAPPGAGTLGTWLFTAGLTIAFAWLLIGYVLTRSRSAVESPAVPTWFWFSTFPLLVSSVALHWSYLSARLGRLSVATIGLRLATSLGVVFLMLQIPGLVRLIQLNQETEPAGSAAYMLILALVAVHGAHILVGLGRMLVLNKKAHVRTADAHGAGHLKQMCLFWHFLAVAWVVMFGVILWT